MKLLGGRVAYFQGSDVYQVLPVSTRTVALHESSPPGTSFKTSLGTSLVAQWLRIHLPMQETRL